MKEQDSDIYPQIRHHFDGVGGRSAAIAGLQYSTVQQYISDQHNDLTISSSSIACFIRMILKNFYFRRTQRGGHGSNGRSLYPIYRFLSRRLAWISGLGEKLFQRKQPTDGASTGTSDDVSKGTNEAAKTGTDDDDWQEMNEMEFEDFEEMDDDASYMMYAGLAESLLTFDE